MGGTGLRASASKATFLKLQPFGVDGGSSLNQCLSLLLSLPMPGISIQSLLNPADTTNSRAHNELSPNPPTDSGIRIHAPIPLATAAGLEACPSPTLPVALPRMISPRPSGPGSPAFSFLSLPTPSETRHNVRLNRRTLLSTLYIFDNPLTWIEYPESKDGDPVGYLIRQEFPSEWRNPASSFVYSLDHPSGGTRSGETMSCSLLLDANGERVPCKQHHRTCM